MARTGAKPLTQVDGLMTKAKHLTPDLLRATSAAGGHGGDHTSNNEQGDNITLQDRGDGASYKLARLKRDDPDLARPRAVWYPVP